MAVGIWRGELVVPLKTHDQFVEDLAKVNPAIRPIGTYVHSKQPIEVECKKCGHRWSPTPNMLLRKSGCPACARKHLGDGRRKTNERFLAELAVSNPSAEPLEEYKSGSKPMRVRCRTCGTIWDSKPMYLLKGVLCPNCRHERRINVRRKTNEEFLADMMELHPEIEVMGSYAGSKVGVDCRCRRCGFEWSPRPNDLMSGHGCPRCGGSHYKTHDEYVAELNERFPSLEVVGRYRGDGKRIRVRCRTCGYERDAIANSLLRQQEGGANCPNCIGKKRLTQTEFEERLAEVSPSIRVLGKYRSANTRIEVECGLCGHRWSPTPASLLHAKSGCPNCYHGSTSVMEQFIYWSLVHALGEDAVLSRDRSLGVEVDVYAPDLDLAIEPGSWYWHEGKLDEDEAKRAACSDAGVRLVTIYDQCPLETPPFATDCLVFKYPLAVERDMATLKEIVIGLLEECGIDADFEDEDWKVIEGRARRSSRRMTTREFTEKLSLISPSIEVLSDYVGTGARVHCRCRDCGNEWSTAAGNLLYQGTKCPSCVHRKKTIDRMPTSMDTDTFSEKLADVSPNVELAEPYEGMAERVKARCLACGHEWVAMPRVLLAGSGCPACEDVQRSVAAQSRNLERRESERRNLVAELRTKTQTIDIDGEFRGMGRLVTARCSKCGFEWRTMPAKLLKAHMCPSCERPRAGSRLKTDKQFKEEAAEKNPDVEVVGTYHGVHQPIEVRCKKCGRKWDSTPGRVLQGFGCGPCNMKGPRKTTQQFRDELAAINDKVLVKSEYHGAVEKVLVECLVCGHEWETAAAHLLSGTGCPECAKVRQGATNRKSHQQFVDEIAALSPNVEVLGTYKGKTSRIECRCRTCGHEWTTSGQSLVQGSGCPACARRKSSERQMGIPVKRRIRKVRCVETGEVFRSATAASHSLGLSDPCVNNAAKKGGTAGGFHWEYADEG